MRSDRLLGRVFDIDIQFCPNCGGELRILAPILKRPVIDRTLTHVGRDPPPPPRAPGRHQAGFPIGEGETARFNGFGSAGSRSLCICGCSVKVAAQRTVGKGREPPAEALKAPLADIEYREDHFSVAGTDLVIDLVARQAAQRISVDSTSTVAGPTCPNGCHICEVEVDPATGAVEIVAYASVNDIALVIRPAIVRGQIDGGAVQGIGHALCERIAYDPDSGQLLSASLMDYALPRADGFTCFKPSSTPPPLPQQRARCEARGRAGHHRRHPGGGDRGGRRAGQRVARA